MIHSKTIHRTNRIATLRNGFVPERMNSELGSSAIRSLPGIAVFLRPIAGICRISLCLFLNPNWHGRRRPLRQAELKDRRIAMAENETEKRHGSLKYDGGGGVHFSYFCTVETVERRRARATLAAPRRSPSIIERTSAAAASAHQIMRDGGTRTAARRGGRRRRRRRRRSGSHGSRGARVAR